MPFLFSSPWARVPTRRRLTLSRPSALSLFTRMTGTSRVFTGKLTTTLTFAYPSGFAVVHIFSTNFLMPLSGFLRITMGSSMSYTSSMVFWLPNPPGKGVYKPLAHYSRSSCSFVLSLLFLKPWVPPRSLYSWGLF